MARPTERGATHQRSTPHHDGGHKPTQHAPPQGGGAHTDTARPTMRGARTNTARPTKGGTTNQHSTPHHGGGHPPTQHAPPWGGGTHQRSTPNHEGGRAPAQLPPRPGDQHNHNRNPTADHTHPNTPTVWRQRQHRTNKTSRAWRQLEHHHKHHQPEPSAGPQAAHTTTTQAAPPHHAQPPRRTGTNPACPTMRGASHRYSTPLHEGGHAAKQHGRPCGGPHASTAATLGGPTRQHNTPYSGRGARTNTARPTMGGATHQRSKPRQEGGHAPAQHQPRPSKQHSPNRNLTRAWPTHTETSRTTTRTTFDRASARSSAREPTPNKLHEAANTTVHQQNHCSGHDMTTNRPHASRPTPNQPGMQGSKRERHPTGGGHCAVPRPPTTVPTDTTEHVTLPLRTRPTNVSKLHCTTLGQTKTQLTSTDTDVLATQTTFGDTTTGSSATEPTQTKATMRRPRQPRTNHPTAAAAT